MHIKRDKKVKRNITFVNTNFVNLFQVKKIVLQTLNKSTI